MNEIFRHPGKPPVLAMVPISAIYVDHNYQRELKDKHVAKILGGFSWAKFGALVLAVQKDGRFSVVEGQHRLEAARLHPQVHEVPAVIVEMVDMAGESQCFLAINRDRIAVTSIEQYWAGLTAGDADCATIARVLNAAGCDIVPEAGASAPHLTNAVGAMGRAIKRSGEEAVRRALLILRAAWPKDAKALRGTLISAVSRLVRLNKSVNDSDLAAVLSAQSFAQMTAHAEAFRKLSGGSAEKALGRTICELFNRGRRTNILYFGDSEGLE
jgi:hypothetical protein